MPYRKLSKDRNFRIKWAGPGLPYIEIDGNKFSLTLEDVIEIRNSVNEFLEYKEFENLKGIKNEI